MNTGDKFDSLPAGLLNIDAVVFECVAVDEDYTPATEYGVYNLDAYVKDRVRDSERSVYSTTAEESASSVASKDRKTVETD
jgi:hypothetical protein